MSGGSSPGTDCASRQGFGSRSVRLKPNQHNQTTERTDGGTLMQLQMIEERAAGMNLEYEGGVEARELPAFLQLKAAVAEIRGLEATFSQDEAANHHMVVSQV